MYKNVGREEGMQGNDNPELEPGPECGFEQFSGEVCLG